MSAYYNEYDKGAAAWLRELIKAGHIAQGEVDERSIVDVQASDLKGFVQCHFFAGIGVWSHALRQAGFPDDRPVWTASLPCQPFSAAGKGAGHADERHLADVWLRFARECRPAICLGEQVEPAIGYGWLDALFIQLEQSGYACGAAVFPACSVGAPHIRSRLYWVAVTDGVGSLDGEYGTNGRASSAIDQCRPTDGMAHAVRERGQQERRGASGDETEDGGARRQQCQPGGNHLAPGHGENDPTGLMGDADHTGSQGWLGVPERGGERAAGPSGMADNAWSDAVWWPCRDGKSRPVGRGINPLVVADAKRAQWREDGQRGDVPQGWVEASAESRGDRATGWRQGPTEPGAVALADGTCAGVGRGGNSGVAYDPLNTAQARVMRLRGYGNALCAPQAAAFIGAALECLP